MSFASIALIAAAALPASSQVTSASTAALGMGDNFTAAARGYAAVAWNPALLGVSGNPTFSFQAMTLRTIAGVDPVTLGDLADYQGEVVPDAVKQEWLDRITREGSEQGSSGFDGSWLTLQADQFVFQLSSTGRAIGNISPGIAQLLMFGNADAAGEPQAIDLSGSEMIVDAYSTAAFGFAVPVMKSATGSRLSLGLTAKYTMGHFLAVGEESTGTSTTDPVGVQLRFPIVHTPYNNEQGGFEPESGGGVGFDVGAAYEKGAWTFSGTVQNVINTFEWRTDDLLFVPGEVLFDQDTTSSDFDTQPFSAAPQSLQDRVEDMKFKPVFAAGAAYRMSSRLLATADARFSSTDGIVVGPTQHVGAGVEFRPLSWLPLRAGAAYIQLGGDNSGTQLSAGLGIHVLGFNLEAAAARRDLDLGTDTMLMVTLLSRGL
jgi:hypothetical protein